MKLTNKPSPKFIDENMSSNIANAFIDAYYEKHRKTPTNSECSAFISSMDDSQKIRVVRNYRGNKLLESQMESDEDILRWIKIVADRPSSN